MASAILPPVTPDGASPAGESPDRATRIADAATKRKAGRPPGAKDSYPRARSHHSQPRPDAPPAAPAPAAPAPSVGGLLDAAPAGYVPMPESEWRRFVVMAGDTAAKGGGPHWKVADDEADHLAHGFYRCDVAYGWGGMLPPWMILTLAVVGYTFRALGDGEKAAAARKAAAGSPAGVTVPSPAGASPAAAGAPPVTVPPGAGGRAALTPEPVTGGLTPEPAPPTHATGPTGAGALGAEPVAGP